MRLTFEIHLLNCAFAIEKCRKLGKKTWQEVSDSCVSVSLEKGVKMVPGGPFRILRAYPMHEMTRELFHRLNRTERANGENNSMTRFPKRRGEPQPLYI